jgi:hypothetical protein
MSKIEKINIEDSEIAKTTPVTEEKIIWLVASVNNETWQYEDYQMVYTDRNKALVAAEWNDARIYEITLPRISR